MAKKKVVRGKKTERAPNKAPRIVQKVQAQRPSDDQRDVHLADYLLERHPELGLPEGDARLGAVRTSKGRRRRA